MSEMQNIQWFPGHMKRTERQIKESLSLVDAVAEIVDARIPVSSRNPELAGIVTDKPRLILLNKCDIADKNITEKWIKSFAKQGIIAIPIDCRTGKGTDNFVKAVKQLLADKLEAYDKKGMVGKPLRVMVVGIPNVGKSSFINRMSKMVKAKVADRPGVTRGNQWFKIDDRLELLDTPGVLWPKFEDEVVGIHLALTGAIKDEVLRKEELAFYLLKYLRKYYPNNLLEKYNIDIKENEEEFDCIEYVTSFLKKYNIKNEDYDRVYDMILNDFKNARIGKISLDRV